MWRSTRPSMLRNESDCSSLWTPDTACGLFLRCGRGCPPCDGYSAGLGAKVMLQFVAEDRELGTGQQESFSPKLETTLGPVFIV